MSETVSTRISFGIEKREHLQKKMFGIFCLYISKVVFVFHRYLEESTKNYCCLLQQEKKETSCVHILNKICIHHPNCPTWCLQKQGAAEQIDS